MAAYKYFDVNISDLALIPLNAATASSVGCGDRVVSAQPVQSQAPAQALKGDKKYSLFLDFDGYKTDATEPAQNFPCTWSGENMKFYYHTHELHRLHEKVFLILLREHRKLGFKQDIGKVEIDLHTLMAGPVDVELKVLSLLNEPESRGSDRADVCDIREQQSELCVVKFRICVEQLCKNVEFRLKEVNIAAISQRLQRMYSPEQSECSTLRVDYAYIDPNTDQWANPPTRVSLSSLFSFLHDDVKGDDDQQRKLLLDRVQIRVAGQLPAYDFIRGTVHIVFSVEEHAADYEYEVGRMILPVLGNYDYYQPRIMVRTRMLWSDSVLQDLQQFQEVLRDEVSLFLEVKEGPMVLQMPRGMTTDNGVSGVYHLGFPTPFTHQLDPRMPLKSTYHVEDVMEQLCNKYLRSLNYSDIPKWIFKCKPNPELFKRGHLLPEEDMQFSSPRHAHKAPPEEVSSGKMNGIGDSDEDDDVIYFADEERKTILSRDQRGRQLTRDTYLLQLLQQFANVCHGWKVRSRQLKNEVRESRDPTTIDDTYQTELRQFCEQIWWIRQRFAQMVPALGPHQ